MKKVLITSSIILSTAWLASAELIVDWGGNYVGGSRSLELPAATDNGGMRTFEYSDTLSINPDADYTPPVGKTGPMYGAVQNTSLDGTARNFGAARISNDGDTDYLYLQGNSGIGGSLEGLIFFLKDDFLNGYDSPVLTLSGLSGTMLIRTLNTSGALRLAVQNGTSWYLSETEQTATGTFEVSDLQAENWGAWDPTGAPLNAVPGTYSTSGSTLNNVTAVGYYFSAERDTSAAALAVDTFQLSTSSAIPEPGSLMLVLLGSTALLPLRWRLLTP